MCILGVFFRVFFKVGVFILCNFLVLIMVIGVIDFSIDDWSVLVVIMIFLMDVGFKMKFIFWFVFMLFKLLLLWM